MNQNVSSTAAHHTISIRVNLNHQNPPAAGALTRSLELTKHTEKRRSKHDKAIEPDLNPIPHTRCIFETKVERKTRKASNWHARPHENSCELIAARYLIVHLTLTHLSLP